MVKKSERETSGMDGVRVSRDLMIRVNTLVDALDHHERQYGRRCKNKTQALGVVVLRGLEAFEAKLGIQPEPPPIFAHERKLPPADPTTDPSVERARAALEAASFEASFAFGRAMASHPRRLAAKERIFDRPVDDE